MLERELTRLAGDNWQANLEVPPSSSSSATTAAGAPLRSGMNMSHVRSNTLGSIARHSPSPSPYPDAFLPGSSPMSHHHHHHGMPYPSRFTNSPAPHNSQQDPNQQPLSQSELEQQREAQRMATLAQIEEMRLLILGMDQRLGVREEKLAKTLERAENEGRKYETAAAAAAVAATAVKT